jgi:protein subunit release factor A
MSNCILEIRAAEGGADAKLLVRDQLKIYEKVTARRGL